MHVPGLKLVMPSDPYDAKGLVKTSIRDRNPVIFVENISLYATKGEVPDEDYLIPLGEANVKRTGSDVTIVALSSMVPKAMQAALELINKGANTFPRTLTSEGVRQFWRADSRIEEDQQLFKAARERAAGEM